MRSGGDIPHGCERLLAYIRRVLSVDMFAGMLASLCISVLIWHLADARNAFQIGNDEGYELLKAKMVHRGLSLYVEVWNDQPPLFTNILSLAFTRFGVDVGVARLISTSFSAFLLFIFYGCCRLTAGKITAWVGLAALLAVPEFLTLYVSVMLEIPAFTLGFLSLLVYLIGERLRDFDTSPSPAVVLGLRWLLMASGFLFGCALQTKFTTVLMLPAILADMVMTGCRIRISGLREKDLPRLGFKTLVQTIYYWFAGLTIGVVVLMIANPEEAFGPFFEVHFSDAISGITKADSRLNLSIYSLFKDYPCIIFSLLGCVVGVCKRNAKVFVPITMLMTAMLLHLWHTPFWRYYYLHIGLPAAWLMGYFVSETCELVRLDGPVRMNLRYFGRVLGCCLTIFTCFSLLLFTIPDSAAISWLGSTPVDRGLVRSLAASSEKGQWIYCRRAIYVFYSDLNSPPELAIVPLKRLWSGELTKPKICELLKQYEVDHIVLFSHEEEEYMDVVLRLGYILEYQGIGTHYRLVHQIRN